MREELEEIKKHLIEITETLWYETRCEIDLQRDIKTLQEIIKKIE